MTYLSGKTQKKNNYVIYSVLAVVFLLVVIFWPMIKTKSYTVLEPVVMKLGVTKDSFSVFPEFFSMYLTSHSTLVVENRKLEVVIEQLENTLAEKDALLREHDLESTSLGTSTPQKMTPLVLYPIMQDITKIYSSVLLSKGFKDGVDVGDVVYLRGNQAVCTIKEVYNSSALCLLLSSSGVITEGVTSSSSINVTLVGRGGHYLANITRDTPINVGEKVYLRSNPKMVLGTVKEVANNDQDTSWHAFIEGAYNPVTSAIFYVQP